MMMKIKIPHGMIKTFKDYCSVIGQVASNSHNIIAYVYPRGDGHMKKDTIPMVEQGQPQ
jgi:hypothetical protein